MASAKKTYISTALFVAINMLLCMPVFSQALHHTNVVAEKDAEIIFTNSADKIKAMLENKTSPSIKDAYYYIESAWGNCYLTHAEYNNQIYQSTAFVKQWLTENKLDTNNTLALCYGICLFFEDTLRLSRISDNRWLSTEPVEVSNRWLSLSKPQPITHFPLNYDYIDFKAEHDYRNSFVTKALATGWGQCNTLPAIYIILAEELGAKAWLSYAPYHSFIKFADNYGNIQNYDPASHMHITDQLYQDYLQIGTDAERSGIYLDTLSKQQAIAACLIELAKMYLYKTNFSDMSTAEAWVDYALPFFNNKEANVQSWILKSAMAVNRMYEIMPQYGLHDFSELQNLPAAKEIYESYVYAEQKIRELGYKDIPQEQYALMMRDYQNKEEQQLSSGIEAKKKSNLFDVE